MLSEELVNCTKSDVTNSVTIAPLAPAVLGLPSQRQSQSSSSAPFADRSSDSFPGAAAPLKYRACAALDRPAAMVRTQSDCCSPSLPSQSAHIPGRELIWVPYIDGLMLIRVGQPQNPFDLVAHIARADRLTIVE